jgi:hypothetical protein
MEDPILKFLALIFFISTITLCIGKMFEQKEKELELLHQIKMATIQYQHMKN